MDLKLNIIVGSTRPGRVGVAIAPWLEAFAVAHGKFSLDLVDLAEVGPPLLDEPNHPVLQGYEQEHTKRWSESVASADAFVFLTPEYDYFPSAALMNAVQCLFLEWNYKPAGVVSYGGVSAGSRASQMLRLLLTSANVFPLTQVVPIPDFTQFIDADGVFRANAQTEQGAAVMLGELFKVATALKTIR
ncbi:NADPH-dependent FMN reductase [compost metagenome]